MYLKEHIVRVENIKTLQTLDQANIDNKNSFWIKLN